MNRGDNGSDFENAATLPQTSQRPPVFTMCKRVDALCGAREDSEIAHQYGVRPDIVLALRHGIDLDLVGLEDALALIAKLAHETGASADWILGATNMLPRSRRQERNHLTLQDKIALLVLLAISILLDIILVLFSLFTN